MQIPTPRRRPQLTALLTLLVSIAVPGRAEPPSDTERAIDKPYAQRIPGSKVTFVMVPIPGGRFTMGSHDAEPGRKTDEGPRFVVEVDAFWMGRFEVTQEEFDLFSGMYLKVSEKGAPEIPKDKLSDAVTYPTPYYRFAVDPVLDRMGRGGKFPAATMSHFAAKEYCKWLSRKTGHFYRLPTEAEWEYAARAGTDTAYGFGNDAGKFDDFGWWFGNSNLNDGDPGYHAAGMKKPNAWGLYDVHGNVAEWCVDAYDQHWYEQFAGRKVRWDEIINWGTKRYPHVIRGGGWNSELADCRSATRGKSDKTMNMSDADLPQSPHWEGDAWWVGFRVLSPLKEPPAEEQRRFWEADDAETVETLKRDREIRGVVKRGE